MNTAQQLQQSADRLAIRELIDQYAFCADSRDAQGQMALFTEDANFVVFMDSKATVPTQIISNRADLFPVFNHLNTYQSTMHFNGQNKVQLNGETASGLTYCIAHHQTIEEGIQKLMIAYIRYEDKFVKHQDKWLFAERKLLVDWIENR